MLRIDGFHIAQTSLALLSLNRDFTLLKDSDFIERHIWSQLVLQAIDVDELAVKLFLVLVQLHKLALPLLLVLRYAPCQAVELWGSWIYADMLARLLKMLLYLVIDVLHIGILINGQKLVALEIPRGLVGVPVGFREIDIMLNCIMN